MTAAWVRRSFADVGVTQYNPGPSLPAVQEHYMGRALLCIDVSWSMAGAPLRAAVEGGLDFLDEALAAGYRCGMVLWHGGIAAHLPTSSSIDDVSSQLRAAAPGPD